MITVRSDTTGNPRISPVRSRPRRNQMKTLLLFKTPTKRCSVSKSKAGISSERIKSVKRGMMLSALTYSPAIVGLALMFLLIGHVPTTWLFSLASFVTGFSGVIIVIRKEIPSSLWTIRGPAAIIRGIGWVIVCWGAALYLAWSALSGK